MDHIGVQVVRQHFRNMGLSWMNKGKEHYVSKAFHIWWSFAWYNSQAFVRPSHQCMLIRQPDKEALLFDKAIVSLEIVQNGVPNPILSLFFD